MKLAAIYPGQGSQTIGMGKFLFDEFKLTRQLFEEASDTLNVNFKHLLFESSDEELALTHNAQPAILLVSTAYYQVLSSLCPLPIALASGHSVGEYAAIVNAGALKFADALKAVRKRGEFMQSAVPVGEGAMLAILGWDTDAVKNLCQWAQTQSGLGVVEPANYNAPGQIVISGSAPAIKWLQAHFSETAFSGAPKRLKAIPLKVSAPFHCSLMQPAAEKMRQVLNACEFQMAKYPVVQNILAKKVSDPQLLRDNLVLQIAGAVRWIECVQELINNGVTHCIELGHGKVLSGLVGKIESEKIQTLNINSIDDLKQTEKTLCQFNKGNM